MVGLSNKIRSNLAVTATEVPKIQKTSKNKIKLFSNYKLSIFLIEILGTDLSKKTKEKQSK